MLLTRLAGVGLISLQARRGRLQATVMTPQDVAVTQVGHINGILWQRGNDSPRVCLAGPRGYADSFEQILRG